MRFAFTMALAAVGVSLAAGAAAQGRQDFTLINRTGYTIDEVYVAPSTSDDWDDDVLGRDVLANGEQIHITFSRSSTPCSWDLLVVYDDGEKAEWERFDLCRISRISLSYDRSSGRTWAESD